MAFTPRARGLPQSCGLSENQRGQAFGNEPPRRALLPTPSAAPQGIFMAPTNSMQYSRVVSLPVESTRRGLLPTPPVLNLNLPSANPLHNNMSPHRGLLPLPSVANLTFAPNILLQTSSARSYPDEAPRRALLPAPPAARAEEKGDDPLVKFPGRIVCTLCQQDDFPDSVSALAHLSSETHRNNLSKHRRPRSPEPPPRAFDPPRIDLENLPEGIETMPTRNYFLCTICNTKIRPNFIDSHVVTIDHRLGGKKVIHRLSALEFKCILCDVIIEGHIEVRMHLKSGAHMTRRNLSLDPELVALKRSYDLPDGIVRTESDQWFWCSPCSCPLKAAHAVADLHADRSAHKENLAAWRGRSVDKSGKWFSDGRRDHEGQHNPYPSSSSRERDEAYRPRERDYETMRQAVSTSGSRSEGYSSPSNFHSFSSRGRDQEATKPSTSEEYYALPTLFPSCSSTEEVYPPAQGRDREAERSFSGPQVYHNPQNDFPSSSRSQTHSSTRDQDRQTIGSRPEGSHNPSNHFPPRERDEANPPRGRDHEVMRLSTSTSRSRPEGSHNPSNHFPPRERDEANPPRGRDHEVMRLSTSAFQSRPEGHPNPSSFPSSSSRRADAVPRPSSPLDDNDEVPDINNFPCEVCNCIITGGYFSILQHRESLEHRAKEMGSCVVPPRDESLPEGIERLRTRKFHICTICGCKVPPYISIERHVATQVHQSNGKNVFTRLGEKYFHCTVCGVTLTNWRRALVHVKKGRHIEKKMKAGTGGHRFTLKTPRPYENRQQLPDGIQKITKRRFKRLVCTTCGCRLKRSVAMADHLDSIDHKMNGSNVILRIGKTKFRCKVCNCILHTIAMALRHAKEIAHLAKKAEKMPEETAMLKMMYQVPEGIVKYPHKRIYWCRVCRIVAGTKFLDASSHGKDERHRSRLESYRKNPRGHGEDVPEDLDNYQIKDDESEDGESLDEAEVGGEGSSVSGEDIADELSLDDSKNYEAEGHVSGEEVHPEEFSINDFIVTDECYGSDDGGAGRDEVREGRGRRERERSGERSREGFSRSRRFPEGIIQLPDEDSLLCLFCNCAIDSRSLEDHLDKKEHRGRVKRDITRLGRNEYECNTCRLRLYHASNVNEHLRGKTHRKNVADFWEQGKGRDRREDLEGPAGRSKRRRRDEPRSEQSEGLRD
ncbi:uncharacterized protein LOC107038172 [Diachasma alloeum]|uniref:uncharacterized protein LOC107038172 n=1 Tax=Diachasma alloeum TaxID=454923 RepID=UPI0007384CB9|nr:uncharacterized protein LOC107038172 [Diachasma alloeum]